MTRPRFIWSCVEHGDMDYWEVTLGFGSHDDAEAFRRLVTEEQSLALSDGPQGQGKPVDAATGAQATGGMPPPSPSQPQSQETM